MISGPIPLVKHGNSVAICIPRWLRSSLNWLPGDYFVLEVLEDRTLRIRPLEDSKLGPRGIPRLAPPDTSTVHP